MALLYLFVLRGEGAEGADELRDRDSGFGVDVKDPADDQLNFE